MAIAINVADDQHQEYVHGFSPFHDGEEALDDTELKESLGKPQGGPFRECQGAQLISVLIVSQMWQDRQQVLSSQDYCAWCPFTV